MTPTELIDTLKHSSLATVLVEGKEDAYLYRQLEKEIGLGRADVLICGGRESLLAVFDRRADFTSLRTAFLADRDLWVFTSVPTRFGDIVFTEGYSIENDLLGGYDFLALFDETERQEFFDLVGLIIPWFAHEVTEFIAGRAAHVDVHINQLVPVGSTVVDIGLLTRRNFVPPDRTLVEDLRQNYVMKLRGHLLVNIIHRFLSAPRRSARYSGTAVLETPLRLGLPHPKWQRIVSEIKARLGL